MKITGKKKILLADDSPTILLALQQFLEKYGFIVVTAKDGVEAIQKTYQESPDLLILDVMMPNMKGYQSCRFLKTNQETQHIPIIMLTVKHEKEDILWGRESGADDYIHKDIIYKEEKESSRLINRIKELLQQSKHTSITPRPFSSAQVLSSVNDLLDEQLRMSTFLSKQLSSLFELSRQLFSPSGILRLSNQIMETCLKLMDADSGSLMLLDGPTNKMRIASSFGLKRKSGQKTTVSLGEGIAGWVAKHKQPLLLIEGLENYPQFSHLGTRRHIGSSLSVPLLVKMQLKGVININRSYNKPKLSNADLKFVLTMGNYLASVIEEERLYSELKQSLEKLKMTQAQLVQSEKMAVLGYFASGMAHEIRNPLAIISAEAQYLAQKKKQAKDKDTQRLMDTIVKQSDRISEIIERMLTFSRAEGKLEAVDLNLVFQETIKLVSYQINLDNISITKKIPERLPKVKGVHTQLEEVFLNLIINAHQAMPEGGNLKIVSQAEKRDFLSISFSDSGPGISEAQLKTLFQPFLTTREKGTGMGLFISNQIVCSFGGWIDVKSKLGQGTSFIVYLPISERTKNVKKNINR